MKNLVLPGQKTRVGCDTCKAMVSATFRHDTITLDDGVKVPNAMLAFCDICGNQVAMAQQSAHLIRKARETRRQKTSVRLQPILFDLSSVLVTEVGGDPNEAQAPELVLKAMLATLLDDPKRRKALVKRLIELRNDPLLSGSPGQKLNLGLTSRLRNELVHLQEASEFTQSEVIRTTLVAASTDPRASKELRKIVVLTT